jgi:hypothetical protein
MFVTGTLRTRKTDEYMPYTDMTPAEIASELGYSYLERLLAPVIRHYLSSNVIENLQAQLNNFLGKELGNQVKWFNLSLPDISVLTELDNPELAVRTPSTPDPVKVLFILRVSVFQAKYIAGNFYPFRWAGSFSAEHYEEHTTFPAILSRHNARLHSDRRCSGFFHLRLFRSLPSSLENNLSSTAVYDIKYGTYNSSRCFNLALGGFNSQLPSCLQCGDLFKFYINSYTLPPKQI